MRTMVEGQITYSDQQTGDFEITAEGEVIRTNVYEIPRLYAQIKRGQRVLIEVVQGIRQTYIASISIIEDWRNQRIGYEKHNSDCFNNKRTEYKNIRS